MTAPVSNPLADAVYRQLSPVADYDASYGYSLLHLIIALSQMGIQFDDLARADGDNPPWSKLLDINRIPDEGVPWFGQLVGVSVDTSLSVDDQRQQIRDEEGWKRGTVAAIKRAIVNSGGITNTFSVVIRERAGSAYNFDVITYPDETIGTYYADYEDIYDTVASYPDLYALENSYGQIYYGDGGNKVYKAILESKPGGLTFNYTIEYPQDYWSVWEDYATYQDVYNGFLTYQLLYDYMSPIHSGSPGASYISIYALTNYDELWQDNQTYDDVTQNFNRY